MSNHLDTWFIMVVVLEEGVNKFLVGCKYYLFINCLSIAGIVAVVFS